MLLPNTPRNEAYSAPWLRAAVHAHHTIAGERYRKPSRELLPGGPRRWQPRALHDGVSPPYAVRKSRRPRRRASELYDGWLHDVFSKCGRVAHSVVQARAGARASLSNGDQALETIEKKLDMRESGARGAAPNTLVD